MSKTSSPPSYDTWLDAIVEDDAFYLTCPEGHSSLPPQRVCLVCGDSKLSRTPLPSEGSITSLTEIHVQAPRFEHLETVNVAIADFGPVRVTGQLQDDSETVDREMSVRLTVGQSTATGERFITFDPISE